MTSEIYERVSLECATRLKMMCVRVQNPVGILAPMMTSYHGIDTFCHVFAVGSRVLRGNVSMTSSLMTSMKLMTSQLQVDLLDDVVRQFEVDEAFQAVVHGFIASVFLGEPLTDPVSLGVALLSCLVDFHVGVGNG